jgi:hypothetical protein
MCRVDQLPTPIAWGICSYVETETKWTEASSVSPNVGNGQDSRKLWPQYGTWLFCPRRQTRRRKGNKSWHIGRRVVAFPRRRGGKASAAASRTSLNDAAEWGARRQWRTPPDRGWRLVGQRGQAETYRRGRRKKTGIDPVDNGQDGNI